MLEFGILFMTQMIMGVIIFILCIQFMKMKKLVEQIIKEVEGYISFITEEAETQEETTVTNIKKSLTEEPISQREKSRNNKYQSKEDAQTQLIQAVLGEYFP